MHIKSIVLNGFKSYGNRVEITGFDPEFNAITGFNGTGKSNILDSICFVLGITNLSNVRAGSLQELIYKHGQAGISKASVSIKFDNKDKRQCPIGYENHDEITVTRQVVMGGRNKYLINGLTVQNKKVSDLFCSVQLNVNNPHFLIMQGQITKVLNMKPPEILSMVEEAAGTRMYETKKQAAQKTIEKKDAKLRELNDIIREVIAPRLQKLQHERAQFQEYQKVERQLENLSRLYIAWKYVSAEESTKEAESKVSEVHDSIKTLKDNIKNNDHEAKELDHKVDELKRKLDEESGKILKQLESELVVLEQTEATLNSNHKAARDAVTTHEKRASLLKNAFNDDEKALAAKKNQLDQVSSTFDTLRTASADSESALTAAQGRFLAVSSGLEGSSDSLQDQLIAAKKEASEASTRISQNMMESKHLEERLRSTEEEFKSSSIKQFEKDQESIGEQQRVVDQLKAELSSMQNSEASCNDLKRTMRELQSTLTHKRDALDRLAARLQRCNFNYTPPEPNFDARRVAGKLIRLFNVHDSVYRTALEKTAGGSLYGVVVDTEVTGKLLLEKGNLQSRVTIIPLNKITPYIIPNKIIRLAQQVGGGPSNVQLALDLISYPPELASAMKWVFGGALVCKDTDTARKVTFHPNIRKRTVTLDGDVIDYSGTISGGAREEPPITTRDKNTGTARKVTFHPYITKRTVTLNGDVFDYRGMLSGGARGEDGSELGRLAELRELEVEVADLQQKLQQHTTALSTAAKQADTYTQTKQRYEMMSHELEVVKARLATTTHAQTHADIQNMRERLQAIDQQVEQDKQSQKEASQRAKELDEKVNDIKGHREREFKKAENDLKLAKKEAEKHSRAWKLREQEYEILRLEVEELQRAVTTTETQLQEAGSSGDHLTTSLEQAKAEHNAIVEKVKDLQSSIKRQKSDMAGRNGVIAGMIAKKEQLAKLKEELQLKIKEQEYKMKELQTEASGCQKRIKALESEHPWITSEREYFGLSGGLYDFAARNASASGASYADLQSARDTLQRGLNVRAHTLLEKEDEQYQEVMRKKEIVESDRVKLLNVLSELDEKKKKTLITACEQVNKDFGSIFSTLLPGAEARLTAPDGATVLDGLQVSVGFNGTWKESLGELSGGQRSLVALSLVLSMLRFHPAPLYILDEVDAALDHSHTQNIGHMLKEHFKTSQFIIVSLKDGMFNNANVLFRTKFVDGMSSVDRTVNSR